MYYIKAVAILHHLFQHDNPEHNVVAILDKLIYAATHTNYSKHCRFDDEDILWIDFEWAKQMMYECCRTDFQRNKVTNFSWELS